MSQKTNFKKNAAVNSILRTYVLSSAFDFLLLSFYSRAFYFLIFAFYFLAPPFFTLFHKSIYSKSRFMR